jgi:hypothetical protein
MNDDGDNNETLAEEVVIEKEEEVEAEEVEVEEEDWDNNVSGKIY